MERLSRHSAMTKKELERQRQQEIDNAWGGQSLDQAINSSPIKRSIPSSLNPNPQRKKPNSNESHFSHFDSGLNYVMDRENEPVRLRAIPENNFDDGIEDPERIEAEEYMRSNLYDGFDEEDKDVDYWNDMYDVFNSNHTNTNPPFLRPSANNRTNVSLNN